jgi:hypothetical protein
MLHQGNMLSPSVVGDQESRRVEVCNISATTVEIFPRWGRPSWMPSFSRSASVRTGRHWPVALTCLPGSCELRQGARLGYCRRRRGHGGFSTNSCQNPTSVSNSSSWATGLPATLDRDSSSHPPSMMTAQSNSGCSNCHSIGSTKPCASKNSRYAGLLSVIVVAFSQARTAPAGTSPLKSRPTLGLRDCAKREKVPLRSESFPTNAF